MTRIDIISGFLGAGKTTFIKRLLDTNLKNEKVVLIENEYGEVSVDSDILSDAKIEITELSQGCICCSLAGDFAKSLNMVIEKYNPDRILIEPSGVGKLSDVIKAVSDAGLKENVKSLVCIVDAKKAKMYDKNFGEFFEDQIENAQTVILSRTDIATEAKITEALEVVRKHNEKCVVITTPINDLKDEELTNAYEGVDVSVFDLDDDEDEHHHHHHHDGECCCGHHHHDDDDDDDDDEDEHEHHHHHHDHDEECCCGHHHDDDDDDDDEDEDEHHHHHHDHDEECCCGHHHHDDDDDDDEDEHHHHHDYDENGVCSCGHVHGEHDHHHHHHADEVFTSVGIETVKKYDIDKLKALLDDMAVGTYGVIVRSKGIVQSLDGKWYVFNLTPEEVEVLPSKAIPMGKIVVIGSHIDEAKIKELF